jgi:hypothetical protein
VRFRKATHRNCCQGYSKQRRTLAEETPNFLKKSEAKDHLGTTCGQGSGVPDLSDDERQKCVDKDNSQQFPEIRSDMPTDDGQRLARRRRRKTRPGRAETNEWVSAKLRRPIAKGGSQQEADKIASQAHRDVIKPQKTIDEITPDETLATLPQNQQQ